jgi:hypothetical protein
VARLISKVLTLDSTIQRLSSAFGAQDVLNVRQLWIQPGAANAGVVYVGGKDVASTNSIRLEIPDTSIPQAPFSFGEYPQGDLSIADVYVVGTNTDTLRILAITAQ